MKSKDINIFLHDKCPNDCPEFNIESVVFMADGKGYYTHLRCEHEEFCARIFNAMGDDAE